MAEPVTRRTVGPQLPQSKLTLSLGAQIRDFAKVLGRRVDYVHRAVGFQLFTAVIMDTPIDTGLARGSWWPSKGTPVMGGAQRMDASGLSAMRDVEAVVRTARFDDVLFLMNNVSYIVPLEYGWSKQQPEGMVRINVARIERIVKESVAAAKGVK